MPSVLEFSKTGRSPYPSITAFSVPPLIRNINATKTSVFVVAVSLVYAALNLHATPICLGLHWMSEGGARNEGVPAGSTLADVRDNYFGGGEGGTLGCSLLLLLYLYDKLLETHYE